MKIGILGCGQISDAHLREIALIKGAEVVAVCDLHEALAQDTAERFGIPHWYLDYRTMIKKERPQVVHITVPPQVQRASALYAIQQGCSVYVEKPFCLNSFESREVIEAARRQGVLACAGFSQVYDNVNLRCRNYLNTGRLGKVVHVESHYGNALSGSFSRSFLQNPHHWIHQLPGGLFQNIISHALYPIVPFFETPFDSVMCSAFDRSGNGVLNDELRMLIESNHVTGYVTFSSAIRPVGQYYRLYGTKAILEVNLSNHTFKILEGTPLPGPLERIRSSVGEGAQLLKESAINCWGFVSGKDRFFSGMGNLFAKFYEAVRQKSAEPPIPYGHVLAVADLLDRISVHCSLNRDGSPAISA